MTVLSCYKPEDEIEKTACAQEKTKEVDVAFAVPFLFTLQSSSVGLLDGTACDPWLQH